MAPVVHLEEGNFNNGHPPPLRELSLEIQVNKLIKEYLFSSNADERCTSLDDYKGNKAWFMPPEANDAVLWEYKENKAWFMPPDAKDAALWKSCNAPHAKALGDHLIQSPHDPHSLYKSTRAVNDLHMQESLTLHSIACIKDKCVSGKEQTVSGNAQSLQAVDTVPHEASLVTESEGKLMHKTANLSRVDTFPCTGKVQLQVGAPCKADTEKKPSCKKPPRPPRLPKSELGPSLTRCSSDNGAYLQSSRRAKIERKRKATAAASNSSMWALLFTFCFAVIMVAQGFWSQGSQNFATYESDTSSPMETFMKANTKGSPEEVSLAGMTYRQASKEGVLAQSYVMRKVQSQHLSDMKHLEFDTFPKS